jgi:hypothetical protein
MTGYKTIGCILLLAFYNPLLAQSADGFRVYKLWTGDTIPGTSAIAQLKHVQFRTVKRFEPDKDGYRFLHGIAIARYHDTWVAAFGHNRGGENTGGEEANSRFSKNGKNWGPLIPVGSPGKADSFAVSHGVLLNYRDILWSFNASFHGIMQDLHTKAYTWNEKTQVWEYKGIAAGEGFWPLQEPVQMDNGEWIMAGASVEKGAIPAVAICNENDFLYWRVIKVPLSVTVWGESTVLVDGPNILLISRSGTATPKQSGYGYPLAWVSLSKDYGHTWSELQPANLPMADSKPYTGVLSTGQRYLIASISADGGSRRSPLTIALSKPGEHTFSKLYVIRQAVHRNKKTESNPGASLAYPYAIEYKKHLYVVYSNSGGRSGKDRSLWNNNSAELAIIPVRQLEVK